MIDYNEVIIYDEETIKGFFLVSFYEVERDKWIDFCINQYQNDLPLIIIYLTYNKDKYFVGFNNVSFDGAILEYVWRNYEDWEDMSSEYISYKIWNFAQEIIDNQKYNVPAVYKESDLTFKQIDIPKIQHWFNENKRVSLKQLEFELRAETIENFEISHEKKDFTREEVENLIYYCHNDVKYTYEAFKITIGDTTHPLYRGKDKILDRAIIEQEVGLKCLNWDDVKIGAEWNKKDYLSLSGKNERGLRPKSVNHFYGRKYKLFFPNTVKFQSSELKKFIREFGEEFIKSEKQEFEYVFIDKLTVRLGKGGLHSQEKFRHIQPTENQYFIQNDIGSQYPNALSKYKIFPKHLGMEWNEMLKAKIYRRIEYKNLYKKTKEAKYNSLQEMGKLSLNGGAYGRLNTKGDWQQDPCAMLKVTIGCQLEILMIVEALVLKGFLITSVNTDGWDCIVSKERLDEYFDIVAYYEELIGNKELGNVEFTVFEWMRQSSVNDYIAKKIGVFDNRLFKEDRIVQLDSSFPDLKLKGDFAVDIELHKNSSFRIIPLALVNYYYNNIAPEEFIKNHNDIFDFCARSNSGTIYHHEGYKGNNTLQLPKLIRYYVSKEGIKIKKIVKEGHDTNAPDTNIRPAEELKTVCNRLSKEEYGLHLANLKHEWYIDKVRETIFSIDKGKKPKAAKWKNENQTSLF